jgi:hypothetical protein
MTTGLAATRIARKIRRRTLMGGALALPWLEVTSSLRRANAQQPTPLKRFVAFFFPGGYFQDFWPEGGTETEFTLPYCLQPLAPFRDQLLLLDGIDVKSMVEPPGHPHARGMSAFLTGRPLPPGPYDFFIGGPAGFTDGVSLDHVLGEKLREQNKFKTLEFGVLWPTYDSGALPTNVISYSAPGQPAPPMADPYLAFERIFADLGGTPEQELALEIRKKRTRFVLDGTTQEFAALRPLVGAQDQMRLDEHLARIHELASSLDLSGGTLSTTCHKPDPAPTQADSIIYDTGSPVGELGNGGLDMGISARMPAIGKQMMDMLVLSLACDLTRVATLQWTDAASRAFFPFLGLQQNHHYYQHAPRLESMPAAGNLEHSKIVNWFAEQLAYLVGRLAATPEDDHTLLDSTLILVGSEISDPNVHGHERVPRLLVGGGSAFRLGRHVRFDHASHNDLLVAIQNAFGIDSATFGDARFTTGPLAGLV